MSKNNNDTRGKTDVDEVSDLTKQTNNLAITTKVVKFLVNVPMYISDSDMEGDSSDEPDNGTFAKDQFNFDINDKFSLPYRTFNIVEQGNITLKRVGKKPSDNLDLELYPKIPEASVSKTQVFLDLLEDTGFERLDKDNLGNIGVSIGLNRPMSLSNRRNKNLIKQLKCKEESNIMHDKFGFFWDIEWTDKSGNPVKFDAVKNFYKQFKRKDSHKAKKYLEINDDEEGPAPPYQEIRGKIKNHVNSENLVKALRKDCNALVYFSMIDSDTKSFNEIYSAYLRITGNLLPTVMSTGYEFSGDETDYPFKVAIHVDRMVRVITVRHTKFSRLTF